MNDCGVPTLPTSLPATTARESGLPDETIAGALLEAVEALREGGS